jgi:uncharacterized protein (TIGR00369 family)
MIRRPRLASSSGSTEFRQLEALDTLFGIEAAGRLMTKVIAPWVQDLGMLIESIEAGRPAGAPEDWQPGAKIRLPFSRELCHEGGLLCGQALMALADTAMVFACSAAWNGYKPMSSIDQTTHFLRPVNFDVIADARIVRVGRHTSFGRVTLTAAADGRPVGMVSGAYAML